MIDGLKLAMDGEKISSSQIFSACASPTAVPSSSTEDRGEPILAAGRIGRWENRGGRR